MINSLTNELLLEFDAGDLSILTAQVTWTTDGHRLAGGIGNQIYIWNVSDWLLAHSYIAGDPDGKAFSEGRMHLIDDSIISLVWSQNNTRLLSASFVRIMIWDTELETSIYEDEPQSGNLYPYIWSQNETILVHSRAYIDLSTSELMPLDPVLGYQNRGTTGASQLNKEHSRILNSTVSGYIEIINANTFAPINIIHLAPGFSGEPPRTRSIRDADWNSSEEFIIAAIHDGEIRIINLVTEEISSVAIGLGELYAIDWNPISNEILYSGVSETGQPILEIVDVTGIAGVPPISSIILTESDDTTTVTESGTSDTDTLTLGTQPTADVVINITGTPQLTVSPATLTFTQENWDIPQTVTVSAVDDSDIEGAHTAVVTHSVVSADVGYNGIAVADVTVTITDNDEPTATSTFTLTPTPTNTVTPSPTPTYTHTPTPTFTPTNTPIPTPGAG